MRNFPDVIGDLGSMRKLISTVLLLIVAASAAAEERNADETVVLTVSGMHCDSCAHGITAMLKRTEGVIRADVSYEEREARVVYDGERTSPKQLIEAIEKLGYKAAVKT